MKVSENGSLVIPRVAEENAGWYYLEIHNASGHQILGQLYKLYVERATIHVSVQPGSEVLLPVTFPLTSIPAGRCEYASWRYEGLGISGIIAARKGCNWMRSDQELFSDMKISENGSLIISNVTLENSGLYSFNVSNPSTRLLRIDHYRLRVQDPVSVPILEVECLPDGRAQISCYEYAGSESSIYLNVTGPSGAKNASASDYVTVTAPTPGPWSIVCTAGNEVSRRQINRSRDYCPGSADVKVSGWYLLLSHSAIFLLYTVLLIFMVTDMKRMKDVRTEKRQRGHLRYEAAPDNGMSLYVFPLPAVPPTDSTERYVQAPFRLPDNRSASSVEQSEANDSVYSIIESTVAPLL